MHMLSKGVSGSIFSNGAPGVLQGEVPRSPCWVPGGVDGQISRIAFWNTSGIYPHSSAFLPWPPQLM